MPNGAPLQTGDVLHIPGTGPAHDRSRGHYHVIVAEEGEQRKALLVPICSAHEKCDTTCMLEQDDHGCLTHRSHMMYAKMNYYLVDHLENRIAAGAIEKLAEPTSPALIERISVGVISSSFAAPTYKKFVQAYRNRIEEQDRIRAQGIKTDVAMPRAAASSPSTAATPDAPAPRPSS